MSFGTNSEMFIWAQHKDWKQVMAFHSELDPDADKTTLAVITTIHLEGCVA